jgi:hypothetical protein
MAQEWNSCSSLANDLSFTEASQKYQQLLALNIDPFGYMLQMQYDLQKSLHSKLPEQTQDVENLKTIGEKYIWLRDNKIAFDDEFSELIDALPGMSMDAKERTSLWKNWKSNRDKVRSINFSDLSDDDKKEAKYEAIDAFHFWMNMLIAMELTAEEIFCYYYTKNAANHARYQSGY